MIPLGILGGSVAAESAPIGSPLDDLAWQFRYEADTLTGYSDGDQITAWTDTSGNGRDAAAEAGHAYAIYRATLINGEPGIRAEAAAARLITGSVTALTQPTDMFIVGAFSGTALIGGIGASNRNDIYNRSGVYGAFAGAELYSGAPAVGLTPVYVIHARFNGASSALRVGGGAGVTGNAGTQVLNGLTMFGRHNAYAGLNAVLGTVAVTTAGPSLAQINAIGDYLADKYGLSWTTAT